MADTTTIELPFTFSVPPEFESIEFDRSPQDRADAAIAKLQTLDPKPTDAEMMHAVLGAQTMIDLLADSGAVYGGILVAKDDSKSDGQVTDLLSALLTVTVRPSGLSDTVTIEWLTGMLTSTYPGAEIGVVMLPTGPDRTPAPAVLVTEETEVEKAVNLLDDGAGPSIVRQLHVFLPVTGRAALADFSISTESLDNWDACVTILAGVCGTITFH